MKSARTIALIGVIVVVLALLAIKNVREERTAVSGGTPAEAALAAAKEDGIPAWLFVHSATCPPCVELEKVFEELEPEFKGRVAFVGLSMENKADAPLAERMNVQFIPTSVFYNKKGVEVDKKIGALSADEIREILERL